MYNRSFALTILKVIFRKYLEVMLWGGNRLIFLLKTKITITMKLNHSLLKLSIYAIIIASIFSSVCFRGTYDKDALYFIVSESTDLNKSLAFSAISDITVKIEPRRL